MSEIIINLPLTLDNKFKINETSFLLDSLGIKPHFHAFLVTSLNMRSTLLVDRERPPNVTYVKSNLILVGEWISFRRTESIKGIMVPIGSDRHICKWSKAFRNMPCLRLLIVKREEARHHDPIEYLPSNLK
ncbi:hypothetical protein H5410_033072 [Solanum commersonii]|uniref:Uncharacterized protein n=1 Tax=Solanum commersonii TaxID=4109 RepID=A0A9J5YS07_SOLCO|nr:hypothetical protein H5410_033072 [Solanum commersonii]